MSGATDESSDLDTPQIHHYLPGKRRRRNYGIALGARRLNPMFIMDSVSIQVNWLHIYEHNTILWICLPFLCIQ